MSTVEAAPPDAILRTRVGAVTHLTPRASLTGPGAVESLKTGVEACVAERQTQVVLDLSAVQLVGSAGLEAMLDAQDRLLKTGGWLRVAHASELLREVFRLTGFGQYVSMVEHDGQADVTVRGSGMKLGELLLARGAIKRERLDEAVAQQKATGKRMGQIIVDRRWAAEADVLRALGDQLQVPFVRLRTGLYDPETVALLDKAACRRLKVLPLFRVRGVLYLATSEPQAAPTFAEVQDRVRCRVAPVLAQAEQLTRTIGEAFDSGGLGEEFIADVGDDFSVVESHVTDDHAEIDEMAAGSPVINLVNSVIQRAVRDGASDVHIEPFRTLSRVRLRIDGVLYEIMTPRIELHPALVSRLKVMANLDISERRLPQDGRVQVTTQGRSVDLRFSSLPGLFGEKVVLRVLDKNQAILDVEKLGMEPDTLDTFKNLLERSNGLILVTGPTGSGKTTTLYAALNMLNSLEKSIVTIEDPVEYQMEVINQNEVRTNIGLGFDTMLRHVLRQDPDIVMVGEIRDRQTAQIAVQAALTGHLVLSTLHTNDSIGAVTRLIDMGVESYLLSSALIGVVAQRLLRTICPSCKTTYIVPDAVAEAHGWETGGKLKLARGRGCPECYDSGYRGRVAIHEVLRADTKLQQLIITNPSRDELTAYLEETRLRTLTHCGLGRARAGVTTIEEVNRMVNL